MEQVEDEVKKKAAKTAVAAAAVTGVLVGGLFGSPRDLLCDPSGTAVDRTAPPPAAVFVGPAETEADEPEAGGEKENLSSGGGNSGTGEADGGTPVQAPDAIRGGILRIPAPIRALIGVPLWCFGWLLIRFASVLWGGILSPALGAVSGWLVTGALLLGTAAVTAKALHPELPVRKILNKRTLLGVLIGIAVLALLDTVLPFISDDYGRISILVKFLGCTAVLVFVLFPFMKRKRRVRRGEE